MAAQRSAEIHGIFDAWHRDSGTAKADLVVIGRAAGVQLADGKAAIHVALFEARQAILLVQEAVPSTLGQNVAIAWKPSAAADRAIAAALPLLLRAERVTVLTETEDGDAGAQPADLLDKLEQAGVGATIRRFQAGDRRIGDALLAETHAVGADLLVMGAYTHSRLAEFILGGATREVLATADLPVLMHH